MAAGGRGAAALVVGSAGAGCAAAVMTPGAVAVTAAAAPARPMFEQMAARDIDKLMSCYVSDDSLVLFDAVPPRQYVGAKAVRKDYEDFLSVFPGTIGRTTPMASLARDRSGADR